MLRGTEGQWFTSNNIAFVFVPDAGENIKMPYIFLHELEVSVIPDKSFASDSFVIGQIAKVSTDSIDKPIVSDLKTGEALAAAAGDDYKMVDMDNIPTWAEKQAVRLIDGPGRSDFCPVRKASRTRPIRRRKKCSVAIS